MEATSKVTEQASVEVPSREDLAQTPSLCDLAALWGKLGGEGRRFGLGRETRNLNKGPMVAASQASCISDCGFLAGADGHGLADGTVAASGFGDCCIGCSAQDSKGQDGSVQRLHGCEVPQEKSRSGGQASCPGKDGVGSGVEKRLTLKREEVGGWEDQL